MKVFCILSDERASRSKSPAMHNSVIRHHGIDAMYVPFAVERKDLGKAVNGLKALNIAGANVTVPYKETIMMHLDGVSPDAECIGAINTIIRYEDQLLGDNTDAGGFLDALAATGWDPAEKRALIIGTGGAARGIAYALKEIGMGDILIAGRNPGKAHDLAKFFDISDAPLGMLSRHSTRVALVINTTSVSSPDEGEDLASVVKSSKLEGCELVLDLNYGRETNFWKDLADRVGAGFMDGLPMLAFQARRSFELWTGVEVPAEEFLEALGERI